ncbi:Checkpoint kinase 2 [Nowakowskiella sp. JEL0407]|nr:Checkpoint kinase 2 [Nowakowskiella sp. JEL0407]
MSYAFSPSLGETQPTPDQNALLYGSQPTYTPNDDFWGKCVPLPGISKSLTDGAEILFIPGKEAYTIGMGESCDYQFKRTPENEELVKYISPEHCRFSCIDSGGVLIVLIEDLSSTGTYVNGFKLKPGETKAMTHGDMITFGRALLDGALLFQKKSDPVIDQHLNSEFYDMYIVTDELGKGFFSIVKRAIHKQTKATYAVKEIEKGRFRGNAKMMESIEREVEIMRKLDDHKNIIKFFDFYDENDTIYIVMELVTGGDLLKYINNVGYLQEDEARDFFIQIVDSLIYINGKKITHRDLKPENYLVTQDKILKLADFGVAKEFDKQAFSTLCGTPIYLAPEILLSKDTYDERVDVYSAGVILFYMLMGKPPFKETSQKEIFENVKKGRVDFSNPRWKNMPEALDLVKRLMTPSPNQRISLFKINLHPWFKKTLSPSILTSPATSSNGGISAELEMHLYGNPQAVTKTDDEKLPLKLQKPFAHINPLVRGRSDPVVSPRIQFPTQKIQQIPFNFDTTAPIPPNPQPRPSRLQRKQPQPQPEENIVRSPTETILVERKKPPTSPFVTFEFKPPVAVTSTKPNIPSSLRNQVLSLETRALSEQELMPPPKPKKRKCEEIIIQDLSKRRNRASEWGKLVPSDEVLYPVVRLIKSKVFFGRSDDCDVMMEDGRASGKHCEIKYENGLVMLFDTSTNGIRVNGSIVGKNSSYRLEDKDEIAFLQKDARRKNGGDEMFYTFRMLDDSDAMQIDFIYKLKSISEKYKDVEISNSEEPLQFGRKPENDIVIAHTSVSGVHCEIGYNQEDDFLWIRDLSTFGTRVNSKKIQKDTIVKLNDGDFIYLLDTLDIGYQVIKL